MAPQILLLPLPIAGNFQCNTALRTVQLETLREAGVHFFSLLVEAKQHFILPRPCTTPAIIKPTFAETEESTTEHLPSTCGSYSSKGCWEMYTHRNVVWFWNSSTFVSSPAGRAGGGHCCPSWAPPLWPRTALGWHTVFQARGLQGGWTGRGDHCQVWNTGCFMHRGEKGSIYLLKGLEFDYLFFMARRGSVE